MTPDIASQAIPDLIPLLDHSDMYVRAGALLALSSCGKAVAPYYKDVVRLADDGDWWVREGVAHVLNYTGDPSATEYVDAVIRNFIDEPSYFGRNRQKESLITIGRNYDADKIVKALMPIARRGKNGAAALGVLGEIGPNARAAAFVIEEQIDEVSKRLEGATDPNEKRHLKGLLKRLNEILRKVSA